MTVPQHPLVGVSRLFALYPARLFLRGVLGSSVVFLSVWHAPAAKVAARTGEITLPTYGWAAVKHPYFRGTDGRNIYPYPMLDFLSRDKTNRTYRTVQLENEYLSITFLPELGGKIHEVLDKTTGKPMFYVNHVIKPGLIGQCGAWISGGVEWNTGPQGHTVSCMQPVDVLILPPEKDGSRSVAIGETERIYGTKWTVVVTLRPGRAFIEERIRIYNPTETVRPYYFWNCTAVPNTPGFRFVYPMTLGCDHAGEKFFNWPIDNGKDLTRGTNYQDASSIFAWHCDQDFFGSYNDDLGRGVVAYANHHQLPGKKAWTWGQGGFGKMHQADLTDDDGPYNEVQTGPLLTQAQVGRLDPCEAVEWEEWWYPVHGIGGFNFANKDVAVNASRQGTNVVLKIHGTVEHDNCVVKVAAGSNMRDIMASARCRISPRQPTGLQLVIPAATEKESLVVDLSEGDRRIARFWLPPNLPERQRPTPAGRPETASEFAAAGWQDYLFARFSEAESQFRKALEKDSKSVEARTGLAFLRLESDPKAAAEEARKALEIAPDAGLARYALAAAEEKFGGQHGDEALADAWKASLDPAMATPARALAAKLQIRVAGYQEAARLLAESGPWQNDPVCRNRRALALLNLDRKSEAVRLAKENLQVDPLDYFARSILWLAGSEVAGPALRQLLQDNPYALLGLVGDYSAAGLRQPDIARKLLKLQFKESQIFQDDSGSYWAIHLLGYEKKPASSGAAQIAPAAGAFPYRSEAVAPLRSLLERNPTDAKAALYLGHVLFHLGRHADGRAMWKRAAELGVEPAIACRALGMAAKTLDHDLKSAREWLEKANQADPQDSIVARDLAGILFALADKASSDNAKLALATEARDRLKPAFAEGKSRSDFVALLARAQMQLDDFAGTARMLDTVRVTVWEGSHEVHDLFVRAHLALGEAKLKAGRADQALAEFERALEYPANLATGRLENAREAHIHYARGSALAALGRKPEAAAAWTLAAEEPESSDPKIAEARRKAREALEKR